MNITEIDLSRQISNGQFIFALLLIGFALTLLTFGKLERDVKLRRH